jgi:hypothetical protein
VVTAAATLWRGGFALRALIVGAGLGVLLGALALLDSGLPLAAAIVAVLTGPVLGVLTARRMERYWPGARDFTGPQRVTVVRAARRGYPVADERLARGVLQYSAGLRTAADQLRSHRWVIWLVLAVALGTAALDAATGSVRDAAASCVYLGLLAIELFWWPARRREILLNAALAGALAQRLIAEHAADGAHQAEEG